MLAVACAPATTALQTEQTTTRKQLAMYDVQIAGYKTVAELLQLQCMHMHAAQLRCNCE
jgi:hypothetical protein